jgi:hypothetical protein
MLLQQQHCTPVLPADEVHLCRVAGGLGVKHLLVVVLVVLLLLVVGSGDTHLGQQVYV